MIKINPGDIFNRLTVIKQVPKPKHLKRKSLYYLTKCECGNTTILTSTKLKNGEIRSCGCLAKEVGERNRETNTKLKYPKHPLYHILEGMINRCYKPDFKGYKHYGGRGITICKKWLNNRDLFVEWGINNGWKKELTIDRINNNKGYFPKNCRFTTMTVQNRNRSNTIKFFSKKHNKYYSLAEISEIYNLPYGPLYVQAVTNKINITKTIEIVKVKYG